MSEDPAPRRLWVRDLHEILFSVNIAFATSYSLLASGFTFIETRHAPTPPTALKYFFLRGAARVNAVLQLTPDSRIGQEITFIVSTLALALLLLILVRFMTGTAAYRFLLNQAAGITAILAVPTSLLYVAKTTSEARSLSVESGTFWTSPLGIAFAGDVFLVCFLLLRARKWAVHLRTHGIWLTLHYGLWSCIFWFLPSPVHLVSPVFFVIVLACSGLAWLLHVSESRLSIRETGLAKRAWQLTLSSGLLALGLLLVLWLPAIGHPVAHPKDIHSLTIKMVRRGCSGACPIYDVTIQGNGSVEYTGRHHVGVSGPQTTTISSEQLAGLLRDFDGVRFFSLQDRAFERCPEAPVVSISVSVDGNQKAVTSDTFCIGAQSGPQADFVRLAGKIDNTVGSDRWVRCVGPCSN